MQSRNSSSNKYFGIEFNFATHNLFVGADYDNFTPSPPPSGDFLLLDGTNFLLLDGTNFLLL